VGNQRSAEVSASPTAIFQQIEGDLPEALEVCPINDGTALSFADNQFRARQDRKMRRHGVLWDLQQTRQLASRNAFRLSRDQQPECLQPGRLGKRSQSGYDLYLIHASRIPDLWMFARPFRGL